MEICRKNKREAHSRLDEVYFDLGSRVEGVEGLLGWTDQELVVALWIKIKETVQVESGE
jgi:hypothetical protein